MDVSLDSLLLAKVPSTITFNFNYFNFKFSGAILRIFIKAYRNTHFFFAVGLRPNGGHGLLILEVFLDHTQRRTTVGRTPLYE